MSFPNNQNNDPVVIHVAANQLDHAALVAVNEVADARQRAVEDSKPAPKAFNVTLHVGANSTTVHLAVREDGKLEMQYDSAGPIRSGATRLREALEARYGKENVIDASRVAAETAIKSGADFTAASVRKFGLFGTPATAAPQHGTENDSRPAPSEAPTNGVFKAPKPK